MNVAQVIVTGAAGFIGQHLVNSLLRGGATVLAVDRRPAELDCEFLQGDITEPGCLDQCLSANTVLFHLAANASVPGSVDDPANDFRDNTIGVFEILQSARRTGCHVIFTSSAAVYDVSNQLPLGEAYPVRPSSPYGAAKVAGEAYCSAFYRSYGVPVKIARLFNSYGPGMVRFAMYDFVKKIKADPERLVILGDGQQMRDYLYVEDTAGALIQIAERGVVGETYNVASGSPITLLEVAKRVAELMHRPDIRIETTGQSWPGDIARWYANVGKLHALGFEPTVSLDEGLRRTVDWLVEHVPA